MTAADQRPTGKTNLMVACEQGRTLEVKIILQKKPLAVASRDRNGKTALHYCAESGSLPCAQIVLATDSTLLNLHDGDGFTPLHLAVIAGNKSMAKFFLKYGADPDRVDKERHSTVHWAAVCGDIESLDMLLNHGANPSTPDILGAYPIHYAAQMCGAHSLNGKDPETGLNTLKKLVQRRASVQCRDRDGREPMLWAASAGSSEAVLILFAARANIESTDKDGLTALHCAASRGHTSCVETLVTLCGSRVNCGDTIGCSPLFYAAAQGQADSVQVLLKYCADPNLQDNKGRTPAHCAASKGQLEIIRILDSNGADLWIRNSRGNLPLHEAVQSGRKGVQILPCWVSNHVLLTGVQTLYLGVKDITRDKSQFDNRYLHDSIEACSGRRDYVAFDLVQWLLQQCPRAVNATNISGRTPLHIAAQKNNVEMCEVLIDYGAHINPLMVNAKGFLMSPLDVSVYQGNQRCAKYLQLHGAVPATKVLENNEINRNLLFSLGNYAYNQKERSDEELVSATAFEHPPRGLSRPEDILPSVPRDTQTRTIRAGQQPPLPQPEVPSESLLTNVTSEDIADASVHIHLSRDDLWSLWESLMQELTSEMSEDKEGSEASSEGRTKRRSSEVRQLKPILTNVYLRTSSTRSQDVIAGESILDKSVAVDVADDNGTARARTEGSSRKRYSRSTREDLKSTLPKVSEVESIPNNEWDERIRGSSHASGIDGDNKNQEIEKTDLSAQNDFSDSVGSDTEHRSILAGVKVTRLRKRRSDGRSWGKELEESETSSGHRPEQRESNPYLKRYFQKQARAAEMRKYLSATAEGQHHDLEAISFRNQQDFPREKKGHKHAVHQDFDDIYYNKQRRRPSYVDHRTEENEGHKRRHRKRSLKEEMYLKDGNSNYIDEERQTEDISPKSHRRRSKTFSKTDHEKMEHSNLQHRRGHDGHKQRRRSKCDCMHSHNDTSNSPKRSPYVHSESYDEDSPERLPHGSRRDPKKFLDVPSRVNTASINSDPEDISERVEKSVHQIHHHHHHHHHHHRHDRPPLEKDASMHDEDHHLSQHRRHRRHYHRKRSRLREESGSLSAVKEGRNLSDGECLYEKDKMFSSNEEQRSRSEMSSLPRQNSQDFLTSSIMERQSTDGEKEDEINKAGVTSVDVDESNTNDNSILTKLKGNGNHSHQQEERVDENAPIETSVETLAAEKEHLDLPTKIPKHEKDVSKSQDGTTSAVKESRKRQKDKTGSSSSKAKLSATAMAKTSIKKQEATSRERSPHKKDDITSELKSSLKRQGSKSRIRSANTNEKLSPEKYGIRRVSLGTKKISPKREIRRSPSKTLKTAQSMSEILPKTTKRDYFKQKSKSASIEKSSLLPDIRLFSVEGDSTDLLVKNDSNSIPVPSEQLPTLSGLEIKVSDRSGGGKLKEPDKLANIQKGNIIPTMENVTEKEAGKMSHEYDIQISKDPKTEKKRDSAEILETIKTEENIEISPPSKTTEIGYDSQRTETELKSNRDIPETQRSNSSLSKHNIDNKTEDLVEERNLIEQANCDENNQEDIVSDNMRNKPDEDDDREHDGNRIQRDGFKNVQMNNSEIENGSSQDNSFHPSEKADVSMEERKPNDPMSEDKLFYENSVTQVAQSIVNEVVSGAESIIDKVQKTTGEKQKDFKNDTNKLKSSSRPKSATELDKIIDDNTAREKKMGKRLKRADTKINLHHKKIDISKLRRNNLKDKVHLEEKEESDLVHEKSVSEELHSEKEVVMVPDQANLPGAYQQTTKKEEDNTEKELLEEPKGKTFNSIQCSEHHLVDSEEQYTSNHEEYSKEGVDNAGESDTEAAEQEKDSEGEELQNQLMRGESEEKVSSQDVDDGRALVDEEKEYSEEDRLQTQDMADCDEANVNNPIGNEKIPQFVIPEHTEHLSEDESTSEAETKFHTDDSDDVQPEPDLTELMLLSEANLRHSPTHDENMDTIKSEVINDKNELSEVQHEQTIKSVFEAEAANESGGSDVNYLAFREHMPEEGIQKTSKIQAEEHVKGTESIQIPIERAVQPTVTLTKNITDVYPDINGSKKHSPKASKENDLNQHVPSESVSDEYMPKNVHPEEMIHRDVGSQTVIVRGKNEFYLQADEIHRSISVQTEKVPSSKVYKKKTKSISKSNSAQKTIAVQTEYAPEIQDISDSLKQMKLAVIKEGKVVEEPVIESDKISEAKEDFTNKLTINQTSTLSSPERHNPSAIFYKARAGASLSTSNNQEKESKKQNRGALFYTAPAMPSNVDVNRKSRHIPRSDTLENPPKLKMKPQSDSRVNKRSTVRDRSLESERAVAIANSAFRKLNSNGELTVFNSSSINHSLNIEPNTSNSHFEMKPACQRRGEYPSLEKPGFLWVHFGSGSSPIHTLKRKPNFTSQKMKRETTKLIDTPHQRTDNDDKRSSKPTTRKAIVPKREVPTDSVTKTDSKHKDAKKYENTHQRKDSVTESTSRPVPPLQVSSKILNNKNPDQCRRTREVKNDTQRQKPSPEKNISSVNKTSKLDTPRKTGKTNISKNISEKSDNLIRAAQTHETQKSEGDKNAKTASQGKTQRNQSNSPRKTNSKRKEDTSSNKDTRRETSADKTGKQLESKDESGEIKDGDDKNNKDRNNKNPRLSETAKSSSFEEGDVRLVIERKIDPGISIQISMKDRNKSKDKGKIIDVTDLSSAQGESDQSYMKDSGYISTSESIHKHRRSITIDLGHTTAKINAGITSSTEHGNSKERTFMLPSVNNDVNILQTGENGSIQNSSNRCQKTLPSKLPILEGHRQRSNSLVFMDYNRSPRRDSLTSSELSVESEIHVNNSNNKTCPERKSGIFRNLHVPEDRETLSSNTQRQIPQNTGRSKVPVRRSSIPIYKAYSDGNLHADKPSPRLHKHSLSTPSIHEDMVGQRTQIAERKMSSIKELSSSPSELRHSDTDINFKSAEKLKLPSILLYEPDDGHSSEKEIGTDKFPIIANFQKQRVSPRSRSHGSSKMTSIFSPDSGSLKLPLLQQPVRCRCSIQPHKFWDDRRTRSAVDCVANVHFLTEEELEEFDSRFFPRSGRSSFSGGHRKKRSPHPVGYRALKTQTLKRLNAGRLSADKSVTFHVDHEKERNTFKLPTEKLEKNKKWQVVFTIGKSGDKKKPS